MVVLLALLKELKKYKYCNEVACVTCGYRTWH